MLTFLTLKLVVRIVTIFTKCSVLDLIRCDAVRVVVQLTVQATVLVVTCFTVRAFRLPPRCK